MSVEKLRMLRGEVHYPMDAELAADRYNAKKLCRLLNTCRLEHVDKYLKLLLPHSSGHIETPFMCDYGYNIHVEDFVVINRLYYA
jgi:maltose O-acetyltransferase